VLSSWPFHIRPVAAAWRVLRGCAWAREDRRASMNRIHQVIFDHIRGIWRVVSEHVRARGKTGRRRPGRCGRVIAVALVLAAPGLAPDLAQSQVVVDDDEVVIGGGGGTRPSPWHVGDSLWIGGGDNGSLRISNTGVVSALDVELAHGADGALHIETG